MAERVGGMEDYGITYKAHEGGQTVWAPFAADSDYWPTGRQSMVNFRVGDLDAMLDRFELWQPA